MLDIRGQLARHPTNAQVLRTKSNFAVVHWPGPPTGSGSDLSIIKGYANYHVYTHGWDGLAYHYVIGNQNVYQTRDWDARLNHAGTDLMNQEAFAILVLAGKGDMLRRYQTDWLEDRLSAIQVGRRFVLGHQESPRETDCPGPLLLHWLDHYRYVVYQDVTTKTVYTANVRREADINSTKLGVLIANKALAGKWVLGKPVKGDSLWLEIEGGYVHSSALSTSNYRAIY